MDDVGLDAGAEMERKSGVGQPRARGPIVQMITVLLAPARATTTLL